MNRRILTIILAVLLAVLGTTAVLIYVNQADARALGNQQPVSVLIAEKPIAAGTAAKDAQASLIKDTLPAASVPTDALTTIDKELQALVTSVNVAQGQLLTRRMLVKESKQNDLVLPEGKLAFTIPVEPGSLGVVPLQSGFKVAVFNTYSTEADGFTPSDGEQESGRQATRLLLSKVEVISVVSAKAEARSESKSGSSGSSGFGKHLVTVAVTQSEAERLIHLMQTGTLSLALVNDDSKVAPSRGVNTKHLFKDGN